MAKKQSIIVLTSGGMDSMILLYTALKSKPKKLLALTFLYGQNNENEEARAAIQLAKKWGIIHHMVDLTPLKPFLTSDYTKGGNITVESDGSYVPNRNQLFFTLAHAYAQINGYTDIYTGLWDSAYETDRTINVKPGNTPFDRAVNYSEFISSGLLDTATHFDARKEYVEEIDRVTNMGANIKGVKITAPFIDKDKVALYQIAHQFGILEDIIRITSSCHNGESVEFPWGKGCDRCVPCQWRKYSYDVYLQLTNNTAITISK